MTAATTGDPPAPKQKQSRRKKEAAPANEAMGPSTVPDRPEAQSAPSSALQTVTVVAGRVKENVQDVPVAITALTTQQMKNANISDAFTLQQAIPDLENGFRFSGDPDQQTQAQIRGVHGIATYFDEIPVAAYQWTINGSFFDLQNFEVLKGPQGTLFGQASNAGAEIAVPNKPGNELSGYMEAEAGDYGHKSVEGAVTLPIVPGHFVARLAFKDYHRDGYVTYPGNAGSDGQTDYEIIRG